MGDRIFPSMGVLAKLHLLMQLPPFSVNAFLPGRIGCVARDITDACMTGRLLVIFTRYVGKCVSYIWAATTGFREFDP
jgi:hypothetical protein